MTLTPPEFWTRPPGSFRRSHRIDVYRTATLIQRDLRAGSWLIDGIPADSDASADLEAGGGIIAFYAGDVLDSGRVENIDQLDAYDEDAGGYVTTKRVAGDLDLAFVTDRLAHPDPATLDTSLAAVKLYNGPAETALKAVVDDNLGPSAHPSRVQPGFTIAADGGTGNAIYDEVRFAPIGELLAGWSVVGGIIPTCRVANGALVFDTYTPRDLTRTIVISARRGTASRVRRTHQAPRLTFEWVGLQGEGTARVFRSGGDTAAQLAWGFRREALRDRRDTNDTAVGDQQLAEDLATEAEQLAVEVDPVDVVAARFGVDYRLGDLVTGVTAAGMVIARQIREVRIECTPAEVVTFRPLLADPLTPGPEELAAYGRIRDLASRVEQQEAR